MNPIVDDGRRSHIPQAFVTGRDYSSFTKVGHRAALIQMSPKLGRVKMGLGIIPAMVDLRGVVDELEGIVADDLWPLPTYQEMLFVK